MDLRDILPGFAAYHLFGPLFGSLALNLTVAVAKLILGYARGEIPDYQLAAFCMAVYFRGMTAAETYALTDAMIRSGRTLDLGGALGRKVVDKHSTGGVGDKTSIAVGPIVAACGVPVGKMSGRGLGHTGGTLDKLESIPGFHVNLSFAQYREQVEKIGLCLIGQTAELANPPKLNRRQNHSISVVVDRLVRRDAGLRLPQQWAGPPQADHPVPRLHGRRSGADADHAARWPDQEPEQGQPARPDQ